jgi:sporulation protein YlmC with PRC-barrel domain
MILRAKLIAAACAGAFAAAPAWAQQQQQQPQQQQQQQKKQQQGAKAQKQDLRNWNVSELYHNTWSANEMIDTDVRGANREEIGEVKDIVVDPDGNVTKVVVEVGGLLEMGDQHIGVPFKDVKIGPDMQWVQVPLKEVENGTYSLFGRVPQGEEVRTAADTWRVNELLGDYASLTDMPRYGMVNDALFDKQGKLQAVLVTRPAGLWGAAGWYGYPYYGYAPGNPYALPYSTAEVGDYGRFDYVVFVEQSDMADDAPAQRQQQARQDQGQQRESAAASGSSSKQQKQSGREQRKQASGQEQQKQGSGQQK